MPRYCITESPRRTFIYSVIYLYHYARICIVQLGHMGLYTCACVWVCTRCIYRCLWIYPYVCIGTSVQINVETRGLHWVSFPSLSTLLLLLLLLFLCYETCFSLETGSSIQLSWVAKNFSYVLVLVPPCPQCWGYRHVPPHTAFKWVLEIWTQVSMLVQEAP